MGDSKDNAQYKNGGEGPQDDGRDPVGQNPTGRPRKSSAGKRRRVLRRLFGGTPWDPKKK